MEQIQKAEEAARRQKTDAEAEGRRLIGEAERAGQALVEKARAAAQQENRDLMQRSEERARQEEAHIMDATGKEMERQRRQAEANLDQTADMIAERVVRH